MAKPPPGVESCRRMPPPAPRAAALLLTLGLAGGCSRFMEPGHERWQPPAGVAVAAPPVPREACAHRTPERRAFFGDLHVHTGYSMDARVWGLARGPDDAYRFARGEAIDLPDPTGAPRPVRIDRPLDFAAVTDHAEWMGEVALCATPGSAAYDTKGCRAFRGEERIWIARLLGLEGMAAAAAGITGLRGRVRGVCGDDLSACRGALHTAWDATRAAAERWYDRSSDCRFTTFHAFEYSYTPSRSKTHRNVIFRNERVPELPLSWIDTPTPEDLWSRLRELCTATGTGCDALAIPHNPNLSNGRMFHVPRDGPIEERRAWARTRAELEPLVEMMQIKGESECRNGLYDVLGEPDELCDFEKIRDLDTGGEAFEDCGEGVGSWGESRRGCRSRLDYVRYALLEGLRERSRIGINPFAFGFVGSTDGHAAAPGGVAEWSPDAPQGRWRPDPRDRLRIGEDGGDALFSNPGGLAGVFAEENSREALFEAMRRRETFATSGPRIRPRLFAGWELPDDLCARADFAAQGYAHGVPMGGELPAPTAPGRAPVLAVAAWRDPGTEARPGGLLERLQVVKGWVDDAGRFHQAVYDVAGSPGGGASVDPFTCAVRGPGHDHLCAVWRDPDFDARRSAVYYARAIENPSCRWSTWQCLALPEPERPDGCRDPRVPKTIRERAWTSPIWYDAG